MSCLQTGDHCTLKIPSLVQTELTILPGSLHSQSLLNIALANYICSKIWVQDRTLEVFWVQDRMLEVSGQRDVWGQLIAEAPQQNSKLYSLGLNRLDWERHWIQPAGCSLERPVIEQGFFI